MAASAGQAAAPAEGSLVARVADADGGPLQPYLIEGELGRGGMGVVLRAADQDLGRSVAMKVLLNPSNPRAVRRFAQETRITAQLDHPGIVPVHDRGVDRQGRPWFTMRLVRGRSLDEILDLLARRDAEAEAEFTLPRLVRILVEVANAVAYAHDKGVIHRDLKPHNLMVGRYGEVQVMDWGLARLMSGAGGDDPETGRMTQADSHGDQTLDGTVRGTPAYMPPEQAKGETSRLDQRCDVYALGAILFEMLTLTPPYRGKNAQAILRLVVEGELESPDRRAPGRDIPRALTAVVMQAMAWHPADRYPSAAALRRDLEAWLDGRAVSAHDEAPWEAAVRLVRRYRTVVAAVAGAAAIAATALGFAFASNLAARRQAESALTQAQTALKQAEAAEHRRAEVQRLAAPALAAQARAEVSAKHYAEALRAAEAAIACDEDLAEPRLLRAGLLIAENRLADAQNELDNLLKLHASDGDARRLRELLAAGDPRQKPAALMEVLSRVGLGGLADRVARDADQRAQLHRDRLVKIWPQAAIRINPDGTLAVVVPARSANDLSALAGMPISELFLVNNPDLVNLEPLRGLPLRKLELALCSRISDLSPLSGMPLAELNLSNCPLVRDLTPLGGCLLSRLDLEGVPIESLEAVKGMPLRRLNLSRTGNIGPNLGNGAWSAGMPLEDVRLAYQDLSGPGLAPFTKPSLRILDLAGCSLTDFSPIARTSVEDLRLTYSAIRDLSPLASNKFVQLNIAACTQLTDFTPLRRMAVKQLIWTPPINKVAAAPVRENPGIERLGNGKGVPFLAQDFWKRYDAGEFKPK